MWGNVYIIPANSTLPGPAPFPDMVWHRLAKDLQAEWININDKTARRAS